MKIRRKSAKLGRPDGVPPSHTLITCTYQKLFKKDGCFDNGVGVGVGGGNGEGGKGPSVRDARVQHQQQQKRQKLHRHEPPMSSWGAANASRSLREANEEAHNLGDEEKHGDRHGRDSPARDLHEARGDPLLPKRRKVKSTRYADFAEEPALPSVKAEKRSRNFEKEKQDAADYINTVASSKGALIASIFYVFDTLGKSGLTASEVVAIMLEQTLPGLKEGGARHTVQVANVLRRSRYFISIGNKQYLPCSVTDELPKKQGGRSHGQGSKLSKHGHAHESCKLYDGTGWHCSMVSHPGFSLCTLHLDIINRPLGKVQAATSSLVAEPSPMHGSSPNSQHEQAQDRDSESSDHEENEDIGPALAKWGRDRKSPGSAPSQKRKMLSLMSIK